MQADPAKHKKAGSSTPDHTLLLSHPGVFPFDPESSLTALSKGKVVVVELGATWCAPCIASIPHLNELAERFKD